MSHATRIVVLCVVGAALAACSEAPGSANGGAAPLSLDLSLPANESVPRSYEVAIATAAADEVRGLENCLARPRPTQADCRKQVQEEYERARSAALLIRGTDR